MNIFATILVWSAAVLSLYFAIFWFLVLLDDAPERKKRQFRNWPFVSVIIPVFMEEDCIKDTLESVLNIDYEKKKLQIIVVDDGSTDKTQEIVKQVIAANPSAMMRYFYKENGGKGSALNVGLKHAKGD